MFEISGVSSDRSASERRAGDASGALGVGVFSVAESAHQRGVSSILGDEKSDALVLCKFDATDEDTEKITNAVRGDCVAFDARPAVDEASLRKWYKVPASSEFGSLEDAVLSRIAIRDVI